MMSIIGSSRHTFTQPPFVPGVFSRDPEVDHTEYTEWDTLQGTNISPKNGILKMIFLFPRWDRLIPWRVVYANLG